MRRKLSPPTVLPGTSAHAQGFLVQAVIALGLTGCLALGGCSGGEPKEQVEATVETVVGKEQTDQFREMKKELQAIETQQADRYKALDEE